MRWHDYFMSIALASAKMSKDKTTQVGCCITKDNRILGVGYNGAPRGFPDEVVPDNSGEKLSEQKNAYMCHAELNAILNYPGVLSNLKGATVYVTVSPCHECAKAFIQVGVKRIIYLEKYHREDIANFSFSLLSMCGITIQSMEELCELKQKTAKKS